MTPPFRSAILAGSPISKTNNQASSRRCVGAGSFSILIIRTLVLLGAASVARAALAADAPASLQLTLIDKTVRVVNATPGGRVVLFTSSLTTFQSRLLERTGAKSFFDDDRDGAVAYVRKEIFPLRSVWVAVDVETGRYAVATPAGFPSPRIPFPSHLLKRDAEGVLGLFDTEQLAAEMLIVRPKEGAWHLRATEGDGSDADRSHNGKLSLAAADATPLEGTAAAPKRLKNGDVLVMIDPRRLDMVISEIGKE